MGPASTQAGTGRYMMFGEIASGGMASVHIGRLVSTGGFARTVAIKRLYPQFAKDPDFVAMFLDEARLVARIKHPNVVPTLDVVRDADQLLLVMEYVQGETLARLARAVTNGGELIDPRIVCAILVGVLHGLHAAHEAKNEFGEPLGIVHRDVSPQNVLVGVDGVPRVLDFGVAKARGQMHETRGREIKGKLAYMSPEQIKGGQVTRATDIWAASVVLWECLTGSHLFAADNDASMMRSVLSDPIADPSTLAPSAPVALDGILRKGLSRDPTLRFATARAMAVAIEQAVPLALPSEVGDWVEHVGGDAILRRAARIREVESQSRPAPDAGLIPSSEFIADALWGDLPKAEADEAAAAPTSGRAKEQPPSLASSFSSPAPSRASSPPSSAPPVIEIVKPAPARAPVAAPDRRRKGVATAALLGGVVALVLLGVLAVSAFIPGYAKGKAIAAAAARGISLDVGEASGGFSGVHLHRVTAGLVDVPEAKITIANIDVDLDWFRPRRARLSGVEVSLDGPILKTLGHLVLWYRNHRAGGSGQGGAEGMRVDVPVAHLGWNHAVGEDGYLEADAISGEVAPKTSDRLGDDLHFTTSKITLTTKTFAIGPWRLDLESSVDATTARVAFDPPVPDGPNAIFTRMETGKTLFDVVIGRSPLYRIGVPPDAFAGTKNLPDQVELKLHYVRTTDDRVESNLALGLYGIKAPPMSGPVEVHLAGSVLGDGSGPLDLQNGTLSVGPVHATVSGPVRVSTDAVSAHLAWKTLPIPCAQLLPRAPQAAGDLAAQLNALGAGNADLAALGIDMTSLAQASGVARVGGTLSASGTLGLDTGDIGHTVFTVTPKNSCGISLFGAK